MSKGTPSQGKNQHKTHMRCRRCGHNSYHLAHKVCAHCGFPNKRIRAYTWQNKKTLTARRLI